ncbi:MAG: hypothetical protein KAU41_00135 [Deltaproteobacteria bacterium]|nr:hypothetical protein [Deltaproteobacteria bacterium]
MTIVRSLLVVLFLVGACAKVSDLPRQSAQETVDKDPAVADSSFVLWTPCTRKQAIQWTATAGKDAGAAIKAASCYVVLIKQGGDKALRLADARQGRNLAEAAVNMLPNSGLVHYLAAHLTGLEAENDPMRGLNLVPTIEREALLAAKLNPEIDHGGPDRMLGELYLRAPGFPVSVGDSSKSVVHYRRALDHGPEFKENRLGLIEALLTEEKPGQACFELHRLLDDMPPAHGITPQWREAMELLKRMCSMQEPEDIY